MHTPRNNRKRYLITLSINTIPRVLKIDHDCALVFDIRNLIYTKVLNIINLKNFPKLSYLNWCEQWTYVISYCRLQKATYTPPNCCCFKVIYSVNQFDFLLMLRNFKAIQSKKGDNKSFTKPSKNVYEVYKNL